MFDSWVVLSAVWKRSQLGLSDTFGSSNARFRGAFSRGKSKRCRGAGVKGACGEKVATSRRNGRCSCAAREMNVEPFSASTSVR
jgi:hypothetical protein